MAVIADDMISHSTVETKAQRVAAQVNAAYEGEAPAYAARIAAKGAGAQEQRRDKSRHLDNVIRAFVFDDASEIVVDGAAWSVKDPNKQPERSYPPTIYVVLNEHTLGYVQTPDSRIMGVSHGSVLRGGRDWRNGGVFVIPGIDSLRPATVEDFDAYRVEAPPNFRPVTAEELGTYRIMSPILPCPEE